MPEDFEGMDADTFKALDPEAQEAVMNQLFDAMAHEDRMKNVSRKAAEHFGRRARTWRVLSAPPLPPSPSSSQTETE